MFWDGSIYQCKPPPVVPETVRQSPVVSQQPVALTDGAPRAPTERAANAATRLERCKLDLDYLQGGVNEALRRDGRHDGCCWWWMVLVWRLFVVEDATANEEEMEGQPVGIYTPRLRFDGKSYPIISNALFSILPIEVYHANSGL